MRTRLLLLAVLVSVVLGCAPCPVPPGLARVLAGAVLVRTTIVDEHGHRQTCYSALRPPATPETQCFDE
jgi:hypothetical protein